MEYDFTDDKVRLLIERTHEPEQLVIKNADGPALLRLVCEVDGEMWPCASVLALRTYLKTLEKKSPTGKPSSPSAAVRLPTDTAEDVLRKRIAEGRIIA